jgi:hypothetical protein
LNIDAAITIESFENLINASAEENEPQITSGDPKKVRKQIVENYMTPLKTLCKTGVITYQQFLIELVNLKDVRSAYPEEVNTIGHLFHKQDNFMETNDALVLTSIAPNKEIDDFTGDDAFSLFQKRFVIYEHVDSILYKRTKHANGSPECSDNIPQQLLHHNEDDLLNELLFSTIYPNYKVQMRLGLGGSTIDEPLARLLAYPMPAIRLMNCINTENKKQSHLGVKTNMPEFTIFSAHEISSSINGFGDDVKIARQTAQENIDYLHTGLEVCLPEEIFNNISYDMISIDELNDPIMARSIEVCQNVGHCLSQFYSRHRDKFDKMYHQSLADDPKSINTKTDNWDTDNNDRQILNILETAGVNLLDFSQAVYHMGKRSYKHDHILTDKKKKFNTLAFDESSKYTTRGLAYAAYHPPIFKDVDITQEQFDTSKPTKIFKIGGQGEHHFNTLQKSITALCKVMYKDEVIILNDPVQRPMYLTGAAGGNPPPYYPAGKGDFSLSQISSNETDHIIEGIKSHEGVHDDWKVLSSELGLDIRSTIKLIEKVKENMPIGIDYKKTNLPQQQRQNTDQVLAH